MAGGLASCISGMKDVIPKVHGTVQNLGCAVLRRNRCGPDPSAIFDQEADQVHQKITAPGESGAGSKLAECGINSPKNSIMSTLSLEKFEAR